MYVYYFNVIMIIAMNKRSDKEMIRDFTQLTTDLKSMELTQDSISWTKKYQQH